MRKTWCSSKIASTRRLSSRASSSEVPKGFSMTTRTSAGSWWARPELPSASTITGKKLGAVDR